MQGQQEELQREPTEGPRRCRACEVRQWIAALAPYVASVVTAWAVTHR